LYVTIGDILRYDIFTVAQKGHFVLNLFPWGKILKQLAADEPKYFFIYMLWAFSKSNKSLAHDNQKSSLT
jgi:hypothetical protein